MRKKIRILADYDQTLVDVIPFYLINLDIFLENLVCSMANFLKYVIKYKNARLSKLIHYFLLEENKRSKKILERMRKRLNLYVDENLLKLLVELSESENYDVKIVSSSSQNIIEGVLKELEKIHGKKFNIDVIASSQDSLVTARSKGEIAKNYNGLKICFVDGPNDVELSENCDISIVKTSLIYYLSREKPRGYRVRKKVFKEVLKLLENKLTFREFYQ